MSKNDKTPTDAEKSITDALQGLGVSGVGGEEFPGTGPGYVRRHRAEEFLRIHLTEFHRQRAGQPVATSQFAIFVPQMVSFAVALADQLEHALAREPSATPIVDPTIGQ